MNAHLFVYTRTRNVDYQAIISPSENFCPKQTRKLFLTQARGVINVEQYDDPLVDPRWLFSKRDNLLLWGIGIQNKMLNEDVYKDFTGRPVRGFFGIIIDLSQQEGVIPFDVDFFKRIYTSYILPIWEVEFDTFKKSSIQFDFDVEQFTFIKGSTPTVNLNYDVDKTRILGEVKLSDVFSSALSSDADTSIVAGFSSKAHAYAHEYCYENAVVFGIDAPETKIHQKPAPQPVPTPTPQPIPIPAPRPKKVYRPMSIIIIVVTIIVLLTIILCIQESRNSSQSPSGGKESKNEKEMKACKDSSVISEPILEVPKKQ